MSARVRQPLSAAIFAAKYLQASRNGINRYAEHGTRATFSMLI
jgi:hypothetical protein